MTRNCLNSFDTESPSDFRGAFDLKVKSKSRCQVNGFVFHFNGTVENFIVAEISVSHIDIKQDCICNGYCHTGLNICAENGIVFRSFSPITPSG